MMLDDSIKLINYLSITILDDDTRVVLIAFSPEKQFGT